MQSNQQRRIQELEQHILTVFPNYKGRFQNGISQQELKNIFDGMCQNLGYQSYDEDIFYELVEKAETDYNNILTIDNFLKVYLEAENVLTIKADQLDQNIKKSYSNNRYLNEIIQELNARSYQKQSQHQMRRGNFLILERLHVQNLENELNQSCQVFAQFQLDNFQQQTNFIYSNSPTFELNMEMPIHSFLENLMININDRQLDPQYGNQNFFYGNLHLQVHALPFFQKKPYIYQLQRGDQQTNINVELTCHIEVNDTERAVQDLQVRIQEQQIKINDQQMEKESFAEQLTFLKQPFQRDLNFKPSQHIAPLYDNNIRNSFQQQQQLQQSRNSQQQRNPNLQSQQQEYQPYSVQLSQQQQQPPQKQQNFDKVIHSSFEPKHQLQQQEQPQERVFVSSPPQDFQHQNHASLQPKQEIEPLQSQFQQHQHQPQPQSQQFQQEPPQQSNSFLHQEKQQNQQPSLQSSQQHHQKQPQYEQQQNLFQQDEQPVVGFTSAQYEQKPKHEINPLMDVEEESDLDLSEFIKRADIITYVWIIMAILQCLRRPMITDIVIGAFFLLFLYKNKFQQHNYKDLLKYFLIAVGGTIIVDIVWATFYVGGWGSNYTSDDQGEESFTRKFTIFMAFVTFFWKLVVAGSYYLLFQSFIQLEELQVHFDNSIKDAIRLPEDSQNNHNSPLRNQQHTLQQPQPNYYQQIDNNNHNLHNNNQQQFH